MSRVGTAKYWIYKQLSRVNRAYHTRIFRDHNPNGVDIFDEDWDMLVILDACRYDSLEATDELPGRLESRISRGSATHEFLTANLQGRDLTDTVYVTATPQVHRFADELNVTFFDTIEIWRDEENVWTAPDGRMGVLPETTAEHAESAAEKYPNKRILVHFTQPHTPYLDPPTDELKTDGNVFRKTIKGEIAVSKVEFREAYRRNLERTLPHVSDLMDSVEGKTVVTADHGELLGERGFPVPLRMWSHPHGIYMDELVRVPWLVHQNGNRRNIIAEQPVHERPDVEWDVVKGRLQNLGYQE